MSYRDIQELLLEPGINVSHETLRDWNLKFAPLISKELRHRQMHRGTRWHLDEMAVKINGIFHWLWRAIDKHGVVLDILRQQRDTRAAKTFLTRLLGEFDVPEVIHTDKLGS